MPFHPLLVLALLASAIAGCSSRTAPAVVVEVAPRAAVTVPPGPGFLPADRMTLWAPGVPGGIPTYTNVYTTIAASSGDRGAAIQSALNAAGNAAASDGVGRVVALGPGTFNFSGALYIPSRVVLRGAGVDASSNMQTVLVHTPGNQSSVIFGQLWPGSFQGRARNLTADAVKGNYSVTVADTTGISPNALVLIDEITDGPATGFVLGPNDRAIYNNARHPLGSNSRGWWCRDNRPISQVLEVASVVGNTVTFKTPFHITYRTAYQAQLVNYTVAAVERAGVEDLHIKGSGDPIAGFNHYGVYFALAKECWAARVEVDDSFGSAVQWAIAHHNTLRDSYIHDAHIVRNGGSGYGIDVSQGSSDNLIENNIVIRFNKVSQFRSAGGGNVFGYNYTDDGGIDFSPGWIETGIQASHYPTPHYELFEGNYSWNADGEFTEGNAIYITFFRNHLSDVEANTLGWLTQSGPHRMASAFFGHRWYNFAGNVLGLPGRNYASYTLDSDSAFDDCIWRAGMPDDVSNPSDAQVRATQLRDGNFDYKTNSVTWGGIGGAGSTPTPIPASLYLQARPAFFGGSTWPWVDPIGATKVYTLPAKSRYQAGRPNG